jgi:hypothetical protein
LRSAGIGLLLILVAVATYFLLARPERPTGVLAGASSSKSVAPEAVSPGLPKREKPAAEPAAKEEADEDDPFQPTGTMRGRVRVVSADGGGPVEGARIAAYHSRDARDTRGTTDARGEAAVEVPVVRGDGVFKVFKPGYLDGYGQHAAEGSGPKPSCSRRWGPKPAANACVRGLTLLLRVRGGG